MLKVLALQGRRQVRQGAGSGQFESIVSASPFHKEFSQFLTILPPKNNSLCLRGNVCGLGINQGPRGQDALEEDVSISLQGLRSLSGNGSSHLSCSPRERGKRRSTQFRLHPVRAPSARLRWVSLRRPAPPAPPLRLRPCPFLNSPSSPAHPAEDSAPVRDLPFRLPACRPAPRLRPRPLPHARPAPAP